MRFELFGRLGVRQGNAELDVPGAKQRALLAYLLLNRGRRVPADRLIEAVWGEEQPSKARNALQAKVSGLRGALVPGEPARARHLLESRDGGYCLHVDDEAVDVGRFEARTEQARRELAAGRSARACALLDEALACYSGELLPEYHDYPFVVAAAEHYRALWLTAVEMHASAWLDVGGSPGLPDELVAILDEHPLRESLRALVLRALARQGRQGEALAVYRSGLQRLREELGVDPGPELRQAHADVLAQRAPEGGHARSRPRRVDRVPAEVGEFIGRRDQLDRLRELLARERLVTVTGPGGIGKTRLVVHALARLTSPADGVWFTDLTELALPSETGCDREAVAGAVLRTFRDRQGARLGSDERLTSDPRRDAVDRLRSRIGGSEMIVVLDRCEHVREAVAELAAYLLGECPELRVLTTTRVLLGAPSEAVLRLDPLPLPAPDGERTTFLAAESVALFLARARLDHASLSDEDCRNIAAIVRQADGIPLAMEVAAGLLRGLTLADLARHLAVDRDFLHRGDGCRLIDTIDRSWRLLCDDEADLLVRVSIIEGSWSLEAARAVAGAGASEVAQMIAGLVDRSLISYDSSAEPTPYRLLDTIRAYARRLLAGHPEVDTIAANHAAYFHRLAAHLDVLLRGGDQPRALRELTTAHADIVAALATLRASGRMADALGAASSLGWYWWLSGRRREGRAILAELLSHTCRDTPHRSTAQAWLDTLAFTDTEADAALHRCVETLYDTDVARWDSGTRLVALLTADRLFQRGDPHRGHRVLTRIRAVAELIDDEWFTAATRLTSGVAASRDGRPQQARHEAETARAGFDSSGDRWGELQSLDLLANLDEMNGDYDGSLRAREDMAHIAQDLGMRDMHAHQLIKIGNLYGLRGALDVASSYLRRAGEIGRELGEPSTVAYADNGLGLVLRRQGRAHDARVQHEAALRHYRAIGSLSGSAFSCAAIGLACRAVADAREVRNWQLRSLRDAVRTGDRRAVALALEGLALACGEPEPARTLLDVAHALRSDAGVARPDGEIPEVDLVEDRVGAARSRDVHAGMVSEAAAWVADLDAIVGRVERVLAAQPASRAAG
ncbi:BTAD domain-containing putative transcriptional regulator [Haloechinothrix sp. LS1_15]|uniref:BTAD domain-containing putative transcriptional regulator n=1 Tax=Haloechinothrix sp. LS1_15 TaxID=2652248 RepID=UPI0029466E10|nr:BTAD domain-containing putative transcriptional regulator [Haloechinothrix sp. LS1_15]MDV6013412.1 AfsR/SARP family transcriptional regulator [Haloechinothrix sp. LS1_15]